MVETLFPAGVVTHVATPEMWAGPLLPEEEACLSPRAVPKRRREFTAGRVCARTALSRLGIDGFPLIAGADRAPIWPPGIVGSVSHTADFCAAAVARAASFAALGLDVERVRALRDNTMEVVLDAGEIAALRRLPGPPPGVWALIAFSAKECVHKCLYPLTGVVLDFHDVAIDLDPDGRSFRARVLAESRERAVSIPPELRSLAGRFATDDARVCAGIAIPAGSADWATE